MEIARIFFFIALYSLVACWLCNIMTLFSRPHKWCELLILVQQGHFGQIRLEFQTVLFYFPVTNFSSAALGVSIPNF